MADAEPYAVKTLLTAERASTIAKSFAQPVGLASRRPLHATVKKNVVGRVPPLLNQGSLSAEAAGYLTNWVEGALLQVPRPVSYPCLAYRYEALDDGLGEVIPWGSAHRVRHIDLTVPDQRDRRASDSGSDGGGLDPVSWICVIFLIKPWIS